MAKTAGGVRNKGGGKSSSHKIKSGRTEKGYTLKMQKNILGMEQRYRNNRDETLHIYDSNGNIITSFGGKGAEVKFNPKGIPENTILTHNHPRSIGANGIMRIGNSFSRQDIETAIGMNAKEIRAVTPTYTFSLKRPAKGWGITSKQLRGSYKRTYDKIYRSNLSYLDKQKWNDTSHARASITTYHDVVKQLAKKYGWDYTKKRG